MRRAGLAMIAAWSLAIGAVIAACGATALDATTEDASPDGSSDGRNESVVDRDAGSDASRDALDARIEPPACSEPFESGALSAPEIVASGRASPYLIGVSSGGLVWIEEVEPASSAIYLEATPEPLYLASSPPFGGFFQLRVSGEVFVVTVHGYHSGGVHWGSIVGGWLAFLPAPSTGEGIAMDESHAYVSGYAPLKLSLFKYSLAALDGGSPETLVDFVSAVAVDANYLYWFFHDEPSGSILVQRADKSGHQPETLAKTDAAPRREDGLIVRNGTLFWAVGKRFESPHVVYTLAAGTSTPRLLVDDPDSVGGIDADDDYLYWTTGSFKNGRRVMRIRHCGGPPEVVADNQDFPVDVAVTDSAIYWVNKGSVENTGAVMRIRKQ